MQIAGGADEKERAELIMQVSCSRCPSDQLQVAEYTSLRTYSRIPGDFPQVLSLSEAQLAQLPPDQRECLLEFKRQIQGGWIL